MIVLSKPLASMHAVSGWGDDRSYRGAGAKHEGMDLSARVGLPVYAAADGMVLRTQLAVIDTAGLWVGLRHEDESVTQSLHLSRVSVGPGQRVSRGQLVGLAGQTSTYAIPPHLHFQARWPRARLEEYVRRFGMPAGGFGHESAEGVLVPVEPLVPVDRYDSNVRARAAAHGIPLYGQGDGADLVVAGLSAYFLWRLRRVRA